MNDRFDSQTPIHQPELSSNEHHDLRHFGHIATHLTRVFAIGAAAFALGGEAAQATEQSPLPTTPAELLPATSPITPAPKFHGRTPGNIDPKHLHDLSTAQAAKTTPQSLEAKFENCANRTLDVGPGGEGPNGDGGPQNDSLKEIFGYRSTLGLKYAMRGDDIYGRFTLKTIFPPSKICGLRVTRSATDSEVEYWSPSKFDLVSKQSKNIKKIVVKNGKPQKIHGKYVTKMTHGYQYTLKLDEDSQYMTGGAIADLAISLPENYAK